VNPNAHHTLVILQDYAPWRDYGGVGSIGVHIPPDYNKIHWLDDLTIVVRSEQVRAFWLEQITKTKSKLHHPADVFPKLE
jgi:hypothetical protein